VRLRKENPMNIQSVNPATGEALETYEETAPREV